MSEILDEIKIIIAEIYKDGIEVNGTRELQNVTSIFYPHRLNLIKEEKEIKKFYDNKIGNWEYRLDLEKSHYDRLTADILHEITRGQWFSNFDKLNGMNELLEKGNVYLNKDGYNSLFHLQEAIKEDMDKLNNFSGRRNVIFSQDCISLIQFICRKDANLLNIYIRSSDTINLLASDYLFGIKLLDIILNKFNIKKNTYDKVTFFTGSSHWYLKDKDKVNDIINN